MSPLSLALLLLRVALHLTSPTSEECVSAPGQALLQMRRVSQLPGGNPSGAAAILLENSFAQATRLRCIVTGMQHSGTTMVNAYLQSIPGFFGAVESGLLLGATPNQFKDVHPFYEWAQSADWVWGYRLTAAQRTALLSSPTFADMYSYLGAHSPLITAVNGTQWLVDKTPSYVYNLSAVMARAPGVPVLIVQRDTDELRNSWITKHGRTASEFQKQKQSATTSIQHALQQYPERILTLDYKDFKTRNGSQSAMTTIAKFVGFEWKEEYFSLDPFEAKMRAQGFPEPTADEIDATLARYGSHLPSGIDPFTFIERSRRLWRVRM